ncbi:MAG: hypothetical protein ACLF0G_01155 [Candidatus Brocadiia bacterium]
MKRSVLLPALALLALAPGTAPAGGLLGAGDKPKPVTLRFVTPEKGQTLSGPFVFRVLLNGGPPEPLTVLVKCFGVTHHFHIPERMSLLGEFPDQDLEDELFPAAPGRHTLAVSVWARDRADALFEAELDFELEKPESIEEELDEVRKELGYAWKRVEDGRKNVWLCARWVRNGSSPPEKNQQAAEGLYRVRVEEFFRRIQAYVRVAEIYEGSFQPDRALRALKLAEEIFETEREEVGVHPAGAREPSLYAPEDVCEPPAHFEGFARYYTRRGDIEEAIRFRTKIVAWYEDQAGRDDLPEDKRKRCLWLAGRAYGAMGQAYIRLRNDLARYEECLEKAEKLQGQGSAPRLERPLAPRTYRRQPQ